MPETCSKMLAIRKQNGNYNNKIENLEVGFVTDGWRHCVRVYLHLLIGAPMHIQLVKTICISQNLLNQR